MLPALLALTIAAGPAVPPDAGSPPSVAVRGDLPKTGALTIAELERLGPVTATWTAHGVTHEVTGVALDKVLAAFGFVPGEMGRGMAPKDKRAGYKKIVVVSAGDGFTAVFSAAELMENMGLTRALLVWKIDGKPVPANEGPFRLAVLTDKEPSRSPFGVVEISVTSPK